jgi:hypothetical protein
VRLANLAHASFVFWRWFAHHVGADAIAILPPRSAQDAAI